MLTNERPLKYCSLIGQFFTLSGRVTVMVSMVTCGAPILATAGNLKQENIISFCFLKLNLISNEFSIPLGHTGLTKCSSFQLSCVKTMKEKLLIPNWKKFGQNIISSQCKGGTALQ